MSDPGAGAAAVSGQDWHESYLGGSLEAEARLFAALASDIIDVQDRWRARTGAPLVRRPFHAKTIAAVANAQLRVVDDLPEDLRTGILRPGARYRAAVRFSNAHSSLRADTKPDLRGVAIRIHVAPGVDHDLLLTNAPASHARDARQFMVAAVASSLGGWRGPLTLVRRLGVVQSAGMALALVPGMLRRVHSVITEVYWSRSATAVGPVAVRFKLRPEAAAGRRRSGSGPDRLRHDVVERLRDDDVSFGLQVQRYVDANRTPIEDGRARWAERDSPPLTVARLVIPRQDLTTAEAVAAESAIDGLAFSPWNTSEGHRPLGNLNRARAAVYAASATHRGATGR